MSLKDIASASASQAKDATAQNGSRMIEGPFDVGNLGRVAIVGRTWGTGSDAQEYLYAEFTGNGRPARIPLAACVTVAEVLHSQGYFADATPDAPAPKAPAKEGAAKK